MPELELLRADHADAVLAFELQNRDYFARTVADRGDAFFTNYRDRHALLLTEQEAGICKFHVLVEPDGAVIGRFNLYDLANGCADLGYRMAEHMTGRGLATETVLELCDICRSRYGLRTLKAKVLSDNVASQRVLLKSGFTKGKEAVLDIGIGAWYQRALIDGACDSAHCHPTTSKGEERCHNH